MNKKGFEGGVVFEERRKKKLASGLVLQYISLYAFNFVIKILRELIDLIAKWSEYGFGLIAQFQLLHRLKWGGLIIIKKMGVVCIAWCVEFEIQVFVSEFTWLMTFLNGRWWLQGCRADSDYNSSDVRSFFKARFRFRLQAVFTILVMVRNVPI